MRRRNVLLLLVMGVFALATELIAQSKPAPQFDTNPNLSETEKRGRHWFIQRCALCHLAHYTKSDPAGYPTNGGPSLEGVLKGATPAKEKAVREFIMKGSPGKMPGFQYSLEPRDFDELIAYMKTL